MMKPYGPYTPNGLDWAYGKYMPQIQPGESMTLAQFSQRAVEAENYARYRRSAGKLPRYYFWLGKDGE